MREILGNLGIVANYPNIRTLSINTMLRFTHRFRDQSLTTKKNEHNKKVQI
ncbi:hypothetical protein APA_2507 [Pseudanabaena sp. lw0831]|nr:hypothetical protein APA_2507 [Pseudanabaena sp. lw0831]